MMHHRAVAASLSDLGDREIEAVCSTDSLVEQDGLALVPQGADLTAFKRNPIVLFSHQPTEPIGRATEIGVRNNALCARIAFAPQGASTKADEACALTKAGILSGVSIGFDYDPKDASAIDPKNPRAGRRVHQWRLYELSMVAVPADPSALVTARTRGLHMAPLYRDPFGTRWRFANHGTRLANIAARHAAAVTGMPQAVGDLDFERRQAEARRLQAVR